MCLEAHYICIASMNFSILHWFNLIFDNHKICFAMQW